MPFKSKSQVRAFFAKERAGELPKGTARRWAEHTPDIKALPEHAEKQSTAPGWLRELAKGAAAYFRRERQRRDE
jgi:hypothetical protein